MTLLILAAGMGSRYGGVKQIESVGPDGELIIDYSIFDAIATGFDEIVFVIRHDIEKDFREKFFNRIRTKVKAKYVFQETNDLPNGAVIQDERCKPWGTTHAIWCARNAIDKPFCVINADDFYGREAFKKMAECLCKPMKSGECFVAGYKLRETITDQGTVNRGVIHTDKNNMVKHIEEVKGIEFCGDRLVADTEILAPDTKVSLTFFGFQPQIFGMLETEFVKFLKTHGNEPKTECILTDTLGELLLQNKITIEMFTSNDKWYGFTYKEDKDNVIAAVSQMTKDGKYPTPLWK